MGAGEPARRRRNGQSARDPVLPASPGPLCAGGLQTTAYLPAGPMQNSEGPSPREGAPQRGQEGCPGLEACLLTLRLWGSHAPETSTWGFLGSGGWDTQNSAFFLRDPQNLGLCHPSGGVEDRVTPPEMSMPYPLEPEQAAPQRGKDPEEPSGSEHPGGPMSSSPRSL